MWREMEKFIQPNLLLYTIIFLNISQVRQSFRRLYVDWPLWGKKTCLDHELAGLAYQIALSLTLLLFLPNLRYSDLPRLKSPTKAGFVVFCLALL